MRMMAKDPASAHMKGLNLDRAIFLGKETEAVPPGMCSGARTLLAASR